MTDMEAFAFKLSIIIFFIDRLSKTVYYGVSFAEENDNCGQAHFESQQGNGLSYTHYGCFSAVVVQKCDCAEMKSQN